MRRAWRRARANRVTRRLAGPKLLRAFAGAHPDATFVEVGSNDGDQHDPLRPFLLSHQWRGVMVEPVPYVFERLRRNYRELPRVKLENAAIADRDGTMPFYHLREARPDEVEGLPGWYDGIGSFSKQTVTSHARHIANLESRLVETQVRCMTFASLCEKHGLDEIDLLLVDTEGYDHEILRDIDLGRHSPRLLVFEHYHLGDRARNECHTLLRSRGYEFMEEGFDTWCLGPRAVAEVRSTWSRLKPAVPAVTAAADAR